VRTSPNPRGRSVHVESVYGPKDQREQHDHRDPFAELREIDGVLTLSTGHALEEIDEVLPGISPDQNDQRRGQERDRDAKHDREHQNHPSS